MHGIPTLDADEVSLVSAALQAGFGLDLMRDSVIWRQSFNARFGAHNNDL